MGDRDGDPLVSSLQPAMRRSAKIATWFVGGFAFAGAVVFVGLYFLAESDWLRGQVERHAGSSIHRDTHIGTLSIDWGWTTRITLGDVSIANSDWGEREAMLSAESVEAALRLAPLLRGTVDLPELRLVRPLLAIEINADGQSNWSFSENPGAAAAAEAAAPDERGEVPTIASLDIAEGQMFFRDDTRGLRLEGALQSVAGEAEKGRHIELQADGELQGLPLSVKFTGGSVLMLRDEDRAYPLDLYIAVGETVLAAKGSIVDPMHFGAGAVDLTLQGPNWADVFPLLRIPAPPTPPYAISMALSREGDVWRAVGINGRIGESDIAGDITIDYGKPKPFLTASLTSKTLDFDDLGPLVGVPPVTQGEAASSEQKQIAQQLDKGKNLFPDNNIEAGLLHVMNMDVTYNAASVQGDGLPIQSLAARVRVEDGRAQVMPLKIGAADGFIEGEMALNARSRIPSADANLTFTDLDLQAFFHESEFFRQMGGRFSGRLSLLGVGSSLAAIMATGNGDAAIVMREGSISGLLVEGAALDIGEALVLFVTEDARVPIRCAGGRFRIDEGRMSTDRLIMDTTDSVIYVKGWVNLSAQTLELDLDAQAKDFSLLDLKSTVAVKGKLGDPQLSLGRGAPIPFLELGNEKDVDCDWLIDQTLARNSR